MIKRMGHAIKRAVSLCGVAILLTSICIAIPRHAAYAQTVASGAKVSFTFDDGYASAINRAAPVLSEFGFTGTSYVTSSFVGKSNYMTWTQISRIKNSFGWEIGGHSVTHPLLSTLSPSALQMEIAQNRQDLQSRGLDPKTFATPFGDYNMNTVREIARNFEGHRPFHDRGYNSYPYSDYLVYVQQVQMGVSVQAVQGYIDNAIATGRWLVLAFHDIKDRPSTRSGSYDYSTANLRTIAAYVKSKNLPVVTVTNGLARGQNIMPGGDFTQGLTNGWSADSPLITADTANMGSFPGAQHSIRLVSDPLKNIHLFSPRISVASGKSYAFKSYLNVTALQSQEIGYYFDEFDVNGNWISGQYRVGERSVFVSKRNVEYMPSSPAVASVGFQLIVPAGSGVTLYIDNVELFEQ